MLSQQRFIDYLFLVWVVLTVSFLSSVNLWADVVYLKNGDVLLVDKSWEVQDEIKYQVGGTVKSIPKSQVLRISVERGKKPEGQTPKYGFGVESISPSTSPAASPPVELSVKPGSNSFTENVLQRLQENLRANPDDQASRVQLIQVLNSIASLQASKGELGAAKSTLQSALAFDRKSSMTLWNLAVLHYKIGEYRAAEDLLLKLVESDQRNPQFHYLLGEALYSQDKIPQAISEWETALQSGPNEQITRRLAKARQEAPAHKELGVLQSAHFILRYDRQVSDYHLGEQMLTALETNYRQLSNNLFEQGPETITVVIYPDKSYFDITQAPRWSGAINDGKIRIPTKGLDGISDQVRAVLTHELVHSFIGQISRGDCPTWFNEGVAQMQEGRSADSNRQWLKTAARQNQLAPLQRLRGPFSQLSSEAAQMAYAEGLSAVEYLISQKGTGILRNIFGLMAQNYNFENAFKTATGKPLGDFEKSWVEFLAL
jgi:tetratricopeptide (TPR) repeat protein